MREQQRRGWVVATAMVGGISTIGGAIVGGFFIQFVPNFANDISDAAPWAIYGVTMLLFMYVMPHGVVGSLTKWLGRLTQRLQQPGYGKQQEDHNGRLS